MNHGTAAYRLWGHVRQFLDGSSWMMAMVLAMPGQYRISCLTAFSAILQPDHIPDLIGVAESL